MSLGCRRWGETTNAGETGNNQSNTARWNVGTQVEDMQTKIERKNQWCDKTFMDSVKSTKRINLILTHKTVEIKMSHLITDQCHWPALHKIYDKMALKTMDGTHGKE